MLQPHESLELRSSFVFDTTDAPRARLQDYGLRVTDSDETSAHLPIVADFSLRVGASAGPR